MDIKNAEEIVDIIDLITFGEEPFVFDEEFGTLTASLIGNCLNYINGGYWWRLYYYHFFDHICAGFEDIRSEYGFQPVYDCAE